MKEVPRLAVQVAALDSRQQHRAHRGGGPNVVGVRRDGYA